MDTTKENKRHPVGAGGIILAFLLVLVLSAMAIFGLWSWGNSLPEPESLRGSAVENTTSVNVWREVPLTVNDAPVPAGAPEALSDSGKQEYGFQEILYEEDGLLVARVQGKRWKGLIALVDDPLRLKVATCPVFGGDARGRTVDQMSDENGAVLAVNGGGFDDPNGGGLGGQPIGNVFVDGKMYWGGYSATVGIDADGIMHAGNFSSSDCTELGLQWALSYGPTLVVDGEMVSHLDTTTEEPRTAVGQRADGTVIILSIAGRQPSALGVSCRQLAEIMVGYGAVVGGNLDGGASSDMYLNGEYINVRNSSGYPRPIPTSLLVMPKGGAEE